MIENPKQTLPENALDATVAEMSLQGVSTRRVTKVMEELCGFEARAHFGWGHPWSANWTGKIHSPRRWPRLRAIA